MPRPAWPARVPVTSCLLGLILTQALACRLWGVSGRNSWAEFQLQQLGFRGSPCAQIYVVWSAALQSGGLVLCWPACITSGKLINLCSLQNGFNIVPTSQGFCEDEGRWSRTRGGCLQPASRELCTPAALTLGGEAFGLDGGEGDNLAQPLDLPAASRSIEMEQGGGPTLHRAQLRPWVGGVRGTAGSGQWWGYGGGEWHLAGLGNWALWRILSPRPISLPQKNSSLSEAGL